MVKIFFVIFLISSLISTPSKAQSIYVNESSLKYHDIFLSGAEFKTLSPVDQLTYLMALTFLVQTNQFLYAPVTTAQCEYPDENHPAKATKKATTAFFKLLVPSAYAFLKLIKLVLSPPVRSQLSKAAKILAQGTKSVSRLMTSRIANKNLAILAENLKKEQIAYSKLVAQEAKLRKFPKKNGPALEVIKKKIAAAKSQLKNRKAEFRSAGGTNQQMYKVVEEAQRPWTSRLKSFAATGLATYGGIEIVDNLFFSRPQPDYNQPQVASSIESKFDPPLINADEPCLYGLHPSVYKKIDSLFICQRPKESINTLCKGKFFCPDFSLTTSMDSSKEKYAKEFCVTQDPIETLAERCFEKMKKLISLLTNDVSNYKDGEIIQWDHEQATAYVDKIHSIRYSLEKSYYFPQSEKRSELTLAQYCQAEAVKQNLSQKAECAALSSFIEVLNQTKASTILFTRVAAKSKQEQKNKSQTK